MNERSFGNAREIRNLFDKAIQALSNRLSNENNFTSKHLTTFTVEDLQIAEIDMKNII